MKHILQVLVFSAIVLTATTAVHGGIVNLSGQANLTTPPNSLVEGALENENVLYVMQEAQQVTLSSDVATDIAQPGTHSLFWSSWLAPFSGTITAGTTVDSYLLHFDPNGTPKWWKPESVSGSVTFDTAILGIEVLGSSLTATDPLLGLSSVTYESDNSRGLEAFLQDQLTLSADMRTLSVNLATSSGIDEIRVITASIVPEPATIVFAMMGLVVFGWNKWRSKAE